MQPFNLVISFILVVVACESKKPSRDQSSKAVPAATIRYRFDEAFHGLVFKDPVLFASIPGDTNRVFIGTLSGKIYRIPFASRIQPDTIPFLDLSRQVFTDGNYGLLGFAFHPDCQKNGYLYVHYSRGKPLRSIISRFQMKSTNTNRIDPTSEQMLFTYPQVQLPFVRLGGHLAFDQKGYLYITVGDAEHLYAPRGNGQNRKNVYGKILRIDVNQQEGNRRYAIPADNPYKGNQAGFREEIYASGFRQPWRFSIDQQSGKLWLGDVGEDREEEIDVVEKGKNYGWPLREGNSIIRKKNSTLLELAKPILAYKIDTITGRCVIGGYVCHDPQLPGLQGKYIYGDCVSGKVWALTYDEGKENKNQLLLKFKGVISSFGEDARHRMYALDYGSGKIYRLSQY